MEWVEGMQSAPQCEMSSDSLRILEHAVHLMEHPNLVAKTLTSTGKPTDGLFGRLASVSSADIKGFISGGINKCLDVAISPLVKRQTPAKNRDWLNVAFTGLTGGVAGVVGLTAMPFELPITTIISIRSIAEIAEREGEDLSRKEAWLACMEVFSLAGLSQIEGDKERYYRTRATVARLSDDEAVRLLDVNVADASILVLIRLLGEAFGRTMLIVTEVSAATAFPFFAFGIGAGLNMAFMNHFQNVARSHFAVRRLEREYGIETVRHHYMRLSAQ